MKLNNSKGKILDPPTKKRTNKSRDRIDFSGRLILINNSLSHFFLYTVKKHPLSYTEYENTESTQITK